jgi:opacity protein-like surface antigen
MTSKKNALLPIVLFFTVLMMIPAQADAAEVKIRLHGGYSYLIGGDLNKGTEGFSSVWRDAAQNSGFSISGGYKQAHTGLSYGGDLIIMFAPMIGIGFGSEFLEAKASSTITATQAPNTLRMMPQAEASAIPLKLSLFLSFAAGPGFHINLHAGVGYYMAKMKSVFRLEETPDFIQYTSTAKANQLGYHAGLGFEFNLSPNIALFIEAQGRYAKLGRFEGDLLIEAGMISLRESGKLYYYEDMGILPQFYPIILVQETAPIPDAYTRSVREAKIDFSGGTALGGIVFKF